MKGLPWSLSRSVFNKEESERKGVGKRVQELRQCERNDVSVLCPTGPELGSWQGSHYMCVSDSSLSHYSSRQLTPPLLLPSFVMQTISLL